LRLGTLFDRLGRRGYRQVAVATNTHPLVLPDPKDAPVWRPRLLYALGAATMAVGAFGPWLAGKFSADATGVALGGDGWILVVAAAFAILPLLAGTERGSAGVWAILIAVLGGFVCLVHKQQAQMDGFRNGWGLYVAAAGCALLAFAGVQWLRASSRIE
jgi:hypothetical protein